MRYFLVITLIFLFFRSEASGQGELLCCDFYRILNTSGNVLLLDVQSKEEYQKHRIPDHIYAGQKSILLDVVAKVNKKTKILVYCTEGKRSASVLEILKKRGYTNVFHLKGGIIKWEKESFPVDSTLIEIP
ncbi:rhodanese-like domain-containing protein [Marinilabilia rubra]|uniref:Rhodanese-like domain-containing protein n=1 Tax=Marinilabilia rubra TaxID=2162893 RepID=A0A2U2B9K2_9BACT|nr:rhodanese-like domain-containing protein [Marinilabilia rubra]PWD99745.1 rhodanese-like domain-containing protein [Marinilabilia rubra]